MVPIASFHDNFDMWDSTRQPRWNSMVTAGKDVIGMWKQATDRHGLHFGVASHVACTYRWLQTSRGADTSGPYAGVPYDGQDPAYLYYTDGGITFHQKGLNQLAHLYNQNPKWHDGQQQAVATIKLDWVPNCGSNCRQLRPLISARVRSSWCSRDRFQS